METERKLQLLHIADLFASVGALDEAIEKQDPERIAFWAQKVSGNYKKCQSDGTVQEFAEIKASILG